MLCNKNSIQISVGLNFYYHKGGGPLVPTERQWTSSRVFTNTLRSNHTIGDQIPRPPIRPKNQMKAYLNIAYIGDTMIHLLNLNVRMLLESWK